MLPTLPPMSPASSATPIKVLLVEDHDIVRAGVRLILQRDPGLSVVGEADRGVEGLCRFQHLRAAPGVDVVLTDLSMPDGDGLDLTRRVKAVAPEARVLILTMHQGAGHLRGLLDSGADGYLPKQLAWAELAAAVRAVARGLFVGGSQGATGAPGQQARA